jgi:hypothetical protein
MIIIVKDDLSQCQSLIIFLSLQLIVKIKRAFSDEKLA